MKEGINDFTVEAFVSNHLKKQHFYAMPQIFLFMTCPSQQPTRDLVISRPNLVQHILTCMAEGNLSLKGRTELHAFPLRLTQLLKVSG